jgi:hypothetical protein
MRYLYGLGTPETFERFMQLWRESGSFESALREAYALASPQFERQWRAHAKRQYGWLQIIAQTAFIWTVLTIAVLLLFFVRRRRDRKKLALLRATEPPDQPAFWEENSEPAADTPPDEAQPPPA